MLYFRGFLAYFMSEVTPLCGSIPNLSHQPEKTKASTGNKGRQATIFLTQNSAYINLETAHMEGNVPTESGASGQHYHKG